MVSSSSSLCISANKPMGSSVGSGSGEGEVFAAELPPPPQLVISAIRQERLKIRSVCNIGYANVVLVVRVNLGMSTWLIL